jgi:hypothetical protein
MVVMKWQGSDIAVDEKWKDETFTHEFVHRVYVAYK